MKNLSQNNPVKHPQYSHQTRALCYAIRCMKHAIAGNFCEAHSPQVMAAKAARALLPSAVRKLTAGRA